MSNEVLSGQNWLLMVIGYADKNSLTLGVLIHKRTLTKYLSLPGDCTVFGFYCNCITLVDPDGISALQWHLKLHVVGLNGPCHTTTGIGIGTQLHIYLLKGSIEWCFDGMSFYLQLIPLDVVVFADNISAGQEDFQGVVLDLRHGRQRFVHTNGEKKLSEGLFSFGKIYDQVGNNTCQNILVLAFPGF